MSALARWTNDMGGGYINFGLKIPENIDWQLIANMLAAAQGYELVDEINKMKEIKSKEDFVTFVYSMSQNYYDDPDSWENANLGDFLNALARWTEGMDGFYQNFGLKIPEKIDWQAIANMFAAAEVYE